MGFLTTMRSYVRLKRKPDDEVKVKFGLSGGKVNQLVEIDNTDFIINDQYLMMENPGPKHHITDIGEFAVDVDKDGETDITGYRFYLQGEGDVESFLQSLEGPHDKVPDYVLFRRIHSLEPQTVDEWAEWMGDDEGISGMINDAEFIVDEMGFEKVFTSPIDFVEVLKSATDTTEEMNTCQLFSREVITDSEEVLTEFAMVSVECKEQISIYIGLKIPLAGIQFL